MQYRVVKDIKILMGNDELTDYFIPAGASIELEPVEDIDQPKEDIKEEVVWSYCVDNNCTAKIPHKAHIGKDQPLTPKDVRSDEERTVVEFINWLDKKRWSLGFLMDYIRDRDFDRLYQQFLSEYKK